MNQVRSSNKTEVFAVDGPPLLSSIVKHLTGLSELERRYESMDKGGELFYQSVLKELNINWFVGLEDLAKIPKTGPVMLVSNHPFGAVDGMILACLARSIRGDSKVLANQMLGKVPESDQVCIYVDPFSKETSTRANLRGLREANTWMKGGGLLGVFPSGEVAQWTPKSTAITEGQWHPHFARMAKKTGATIVPLYFQGRNSLTFQLLSQIHPFLKLAMLPKELIKKENIIINLRIGNPIKPDKLDRYPTDIEATAYLRHRTLLLSQRKEITDIQTKQNVTVRMASVIQPVDREALNLEVEGLEPDQLLVSAGEFQVFCARAGQIPNGLKEIGRLRELSFRAVGEGTGKSLDLDLFDEYYLHLFLWHPARREIAGAYRLGETDKIFSKYGPKGFYTHSLFKFKNDFFDQLGCALEMGRSFVSPEYQKSFSPLLLLWKGIAAFISKHPKYKVLFGPVSISAEYSALSREWMVHYLQTQCASSKLAKLLKPRNPFKSKLTKKLGLREAGGALDQGHLAELIEELEGGSRSIPVLIKQYLKLGGQVVGFNLDPTFGDCLDGLIVVDLLKTDTKNLQKYLGKTEAAAYLAHHQSNR